MQAKMNDESPSVESQSSQYLTFELAAGEYAIDILKVQEIKSWGPVTQLPRSPSYVLGVINLRGAIVPVIDLRTRFDLPSVDTTSKTAIIIVQGESLEGPKTMGIVVDQVSEVYHFQTDQIQTSTTIGGNIDADFIYGLAKTDEKLVIVLELSKILDCDGSAAEVDLGGGSHE